MILYKHTNEDGIRYSLSFVRIAIVHSIIAYSQIIVVTVIGRRRRYHSAIGYVDIS